MTLKKWMFWGLVALAAVGVYYLLKDKAGISISRADKPAEVKEVEEVDPAVVNPPAGVVKPN